MAQGVIVERLLRRKDPGRKCAESLCGHDVVVVGVVINVGGDDGGGCRVLLLLVLGVVVDAGSRLLS